MVCVSAQWAPSQSPPSSPADKTTAAAENPIFRAGTDLVLVPVVVRDREGKAIGNLRQEDFTLFDKGKKQEISKFSIEKTTGVEALVPVRSDPASAPSSPPRPSAPVVANHFVAYLFDDVHTSFGDLAQARDAARKQIKETLQPADRVAIFTTSGQTVLDFTDDRAAIEAALLRLRARAKSHNPNECPDISFYMADLIVNRKDVSALNTAILDTISCMNLAPNQTSTAERVVRGKVSGILNEGDYEARLALITLNDVVKRIAAMPGQRILVLVSAGFLLTYDRRSEESDIMDRAIRANVTINTLDARGLVASAGIDASQRGSPAQVQTAKSQYQRESARLEGDVLGEFADATGGTWFHNRNDLAQGFRYVAASPEYTYVLGFSPQNLKNDGSFHALKVSLKNSSGLVLQVRRGYYAPKHQMDPAERAKEEVQLAMFSRDEIQGIPVSVNTKFSKGSDNKAGLDVQAHIDLKAVRFRVADGKHSNSLTLVVGLFDNNGVMVTATQKNIDLGFKDDTFEARIAAGLTVSVRFEVAPGSYVLRLVLRDSEAQSITAQNTSIQVAR